MLRRALIKACKKSMSQNRGINVLIKNKLESPKPQKANAEFR